MVAAALKRSRLDPGDDAPPLARRLARAIEGEVLFGAFDRGRYSTDASIYQVEPAGVVVPRTDADVAAALALAREFETPVIARGGGTSQAGQTIGSGLVIDHAKHLNQMLELDVERRTVWVEPGLVLDRLNHQLRAHGLFFPVDISTGSRATLGGMAANNACGARSLRYGIMVDNLLAIDARLADGETGLFAPTPGNLGAADLAPRQLGLIQMLRDLAAAEAAEIARAFPAVQRRVAGYNLDRIDPAGDNPAAVLVGSEGTLALFRRLQLQLQPLPAHRVLGVCHFPSFRQAMTATARIVDLGPVAVELVDRSILELGRQIPAYRPLIERVVRGRPDALLLVEFAGEDRDVLVRDLRGLAELMADLGHEGAVVEALDPALQAKVWDLRQAGLNIVMSMKGDGKPVSFIEDCAVPLAELADYTERLTEIFARHGTSGTWYAHAAVGCLHVRPILNLKQDLGVRAMRAIAEEAFALVQSLGGAYSGEHGDGLVRSEFVERAYGPRLTRAFEAVKDAFDPAGLLNPGKVVRAPKMDERRLLRWPPDYRAVAHDPVLDWSAWGGFLGATEMCNNNGACRKAAGGVMCPSFRVTGDERHVTRGRANTLRLALSGQLGAEALLADDMAATFDLCVSCKACRLECPTGVDMARMKIEVLAARQRRHGLGRRERLIAGLPRHAPNAHRLRALAGLRDLMPGGPQLLERLLGISARRSLPRFHPQPFWPPRPVTADPSGLGADAPEVVLLADTFTTWFAPDDARSACRVLAAAGYRVHLPAPPDGRPLCCGRSFLAVGQVDQARAEAERTLEVLAPWLGRGLPVVGLEPACLLTFRDELAVLLPGAEAEALAAAAVTLEELLWREHTAGRLDLRLRPIEARRALVHGHCHQKSFGLMAAVTGCLELIPEARGDHDRQQLLRHGRVIRFRGRTFRPVDGDGRAGPAAGDPRRRAGHPAGGRWHQLPAPNPGRHRPHRPARRPGPGAGAGLKLRRRAMPDPAAAQRPIEPGDHPRPSARAPAW